MRAEEFGLVIEPERPYRAALARAAEILRRSHGFRTVAQLAEHSGLSVSTAYKIEGGKDLSSSLTLETLRRYSEAIGVSLGELFSLADEIHARTNRD